MDFNDEINNLIEDFDKINFEEIKEYEVKMNTGGGPVGTTERGESSRQPQSTVFQDSDNESIGKSPTINLRKKNKPTYSYINKIKEERFIPIDNYREPIITQGSKLNIDCKKDRKKTIIEWRNDMLSYFLSTEDETYMRVTKKVDYVINSWEGMIQNWWEGLSSEAQAINRGHMESGYR